LNLLGRNRYCMTNCIHAICTCDFAHVCNCTTIPFIISSCI